LGQGLSFEWAALAILVCFNAGPGLAANVEIIAHRGASGYLPENTLPGYALAYGLGAHWIELDVVLTHDRIPIALHDLTLERTTNVADVFPGRQRSDGKFYAADFTLTEIRQLDIVERFEKRYPAKFATFRVPSLREVVELVVGLNKSTGCRVGIYPELKDPSRQPGLAQRILKVLDGFDLPKLIQSFDATALESLDTSIPRVQLLGRAPTTERLDHIATYAAAIGPAKSLIYTNPDLVTLANDRGLAVHAYTLRADWLGEGFSSFDEEVQTLVQLGVDGFFTDHPDQAALAVGAERLCRYGR
jgi:glycerophosphoryl diester phosphodiesterase